MIPGGNESVSFDSAVGKTPETETLEGATDAPVSAHWLGHVVRSLFILTVVYTIDEGPV